MEMTNIITVIFIILGAISLFRPYLLLFLLSTLPVLTFLPTLSQKQGEFEIVRLGSVSIYAFDYLIFISAIIIVTFILKNYINKTNSTKIIFSSPITISVILLFFWNLFMGLLSYQKGYKLQNVLRWVSIEAFMIIVIITPFIKNINIKKHQFFNYTILLGVTLSIFAIIRYTITDQLEITSSGTVRTLLGNTVVLFILPLCYVLFYSSYWHKHKISSLCIVFLLFIGIHFTGHRSGYIVFLFILMMYILTLVVNNIKYFWIPFLCAALFFFLILIGLYVDSGPGKSPISDMFLRASDTLNLENETTLDRLAKWKISYKIMREKPILGLARLPVFTDTVYEYNQSHLKSFDELDRAPHNIFFNKMIHEGLLGTTILIIFFFVIFKQFAKIISTERSYAKFSKYYLLAFLIFSFFNTPFSDSQGKIYFFIFLAFLNSEILKESLNLKDPCR